MDVVATVEPVEGSADWRGRGAMAGRDLTWRIRLTVRPARPFDGSAVPQGMAVVLDRSHHVAPAMLQALLAGVAEGAAHLSPRDHLALLLVDRQHQLLTSPAQVGERPDWVAAQLRGVGAGEGANLCGGWLRARQQLEQASWILDGHAASTRHILLCSAGHADTGISDPATLAELARSARYRGIGTSTLAVGDGANRPLLEALALAGGGRCHSVSTAAEVAEAMGLERHHLGSRSVRGVSARLMPSEGVHVDAVEGGWPLRRAEGSVRVDVTVGDLLAEQPVVLEVMVRCGATQWDRLRAARAPLLVAQMDGERFTSRGGTEFRTVVLPVHAHP